MKTRSETLRNVGLILKLNTSLSYLWVLTGRLVKILTGFMTHGYGYLWPQVITGAGLGSQNFHRYPQVNRYLCRDKLNQFGQNRGYEDDQVAVISAMLMCFQYCPSNT